MGGHCGNQAISSFSVSSAQCSADQERVIQRTHNVSHSTGVMRQEESCMPGFSPTGKWTDLQSNLMHNGKYVNALQDDNKNMKKPQTIEQVAILRQKHLYLSIYFLKKLRLFAYYLKKDITTLMKK